MMEQHEKTHLAGLFDWTSSMIYLASFSLAFGLGAVWLAIPFLVRDFGYPDTYVGGCFTANLGTYVGVCILAAFWGGNLPVRRTAQLGALANAFTIALLLVILYVRPTGVMLLTNVMLGLQGAALGFYWPYLASWLTAEHEGTVLNRRLSIFNGAWSLAGISSPVIAGHLAETNLLVPVFVAVAAMLLATVALLCAGGKRVTVQSAPIADPVEPAAPPGKPKPDQRLRYFRIMARLAMVGGFFCVGAVRAHLGILLKENLGFSESHFGLTLTVMCVFTFGAFMLAGLTRRWHFNLTLLWGGQMLLLGCMILLGCRTTALGWFCLATGCLGAINALVYSSHIYYGFSGSRRRSVSMAIHESLLAGGIVAGALLGGIAAEQVGRRAPYQMAAMLVAAMLLTQAVVWWRFLRRNRPET